jgi:hypothetical protein
MGNLLRFLGMLCTSPGCFFSWTTTLGNVLTIDNLQKRGFFLQEWCCMCKRSGENVDHLFLHCFVSMELWSLVFGLFGE